MARRRREPKIRNPFNYGDLVADESFTDRQDELRQLKSDIVNGQNVALNSNFLNATSYQLPFSARSGAKLSF